MNTLTELHNYLEKYNYPDINKCSKEEVADIFHAKNRLFLASWFVRQIDPVGLQLESSEKKELFLSEFVYKHGFCKASEKEAFIRADSALDLIELVNIFLRMFKSIDDVEEYKNTSRYDEPMPLITYEDTAEFLHKEVNLCSSLSTPRVRNVEERRQKINDLLEEYKSLREMVIAEESESFLSAKDEFEESDENTIDVKNLERCVCNFGVNSSTLINHRNVHHLPYKLRMSEKDVQELYERVSAVSKVIKNKNTISTFTRQNESQLKPNQSSFLSIIKELALESLNVLKEKD